MRAVQPLVRPSLYGSVHCVIRPTRCVLCCAAREQARLIWCLVCAVMACSPDSGSLCKPLRCDATCSAALTHGADTTVGADARRPERLLRPLARAAAALQREESTVPFVAVARPVWLVPRAFAEALWLDMRWLQSAVSMKLKGLQARFNGPYICDSSLPAYRACGDKQGAHHTAVFEPRLLRQDTLATKIYRKCVKSLTADLAKGIVKLVCMC